MNPYSVALVIWAMVSGPGDDVRVYALASQDHPTITSCVRDRNSGVSAAKLTGERVLFAVCVSPEDAANDLARYGCRFVDLGKSGVFTYKCRDIKRSDLP